MASDALVAQVKTTPEHRAEDHGHKDRRQWTTNSNMGSDRTAQIAGQKDRAEHRCTRNQIQDRAGDQHDAETDNYTLRVSQIYRSLDDKRRLHHFHYAVEK
jgi:hypothetical protein